MNEVSGKDKQYDVRVTIARSAFSFHLYPEWPPGSDLTSDTSDLIFTLSDIAFVDPAGKKHTFEGVTINLHDKQEQILKMPVSDDPKIRYRQDFKNFFRVTFIENPAIETQVTAPVAAPTHPPMDSEVQIFVQDELINKDFKNIARTIPIGFSNIYATIQG